MKGIKIHPYKLVSVLLLAATIMCYSTSLYNHIGFVTTAVSFLILFSCRPFLFDRKVIIILFLSFCTIIYFIVHTMMTNQGISVLHLVISTVLSAVSVCIYSRCYDRYYIQNENTGFGFEDKVIDFLVYVNSAWIIWELYKYTMNSLGAWEVRRSASLWTFPGDMNYVDFDVVCIFAVLIAVKREKILLAGFLSICIFIIMPGRTFRLFLILLIAGGGLVKLYKNLKNDNSFVKWSLFLVLATLLFSFVWCYGLTGIFTVKESHEGLYDFSNYYRFRANIYSLGVIIKEKLLFNGLTEAQFQRYDSYLPNFLNMSSVTTLDQIAGPHNSYYSVMLYWGVLPFIILVLLINVIVKNRNSTDFFVIYVLPYMLTACILHDMFVGIRLFALFTVWMLPKPTSTKKKHLRIRVRKQRQGRLAYK